MKKLVRLKQRESCFDAMYDRESWNSRLCGGLHYRFDPKVGIAQEETVGSYTVEKPKNDGAE